MLKEKSPKVTGNNYSVYIHTNKTNGKKYVGITRQIVDTRLKQHNRAGKGFEDLMVIISGLTRNQARAIEQYFIENGPSELNKINSIAKTAEYYNEALRWAEEFLGGIK